MVWITLVGSEPIDTEAASVLLVVMGPSIIIGKAIVFKTKAFVFSRAIFVGSYLIWNFTKDTKLVPGSTIISTEKVSPIFFWIGALIVDTGVNESDVEALARLRVSCLRSVRSTVKGIVMRIMPMRVRINIFLFIDYNNIITIILSILIVKKNNCCVKMYYCPGWVAISRRKRL